MIFHIYVNVYQRIVSKYHVDVPSAHPLWFCLVFPTLDKQFKQKFKNGHETRHFKSYRFTKSLGKNTKQRHLLAKINIGSKRLQDDNVRIIQEKHRLNG